MPIALPADSLGPKPTKKQMELLKVMASPGVTVHTYVGIRDEGGAYIKVAEWADQAPSKVKVKKSDVYKFVDWGWLVEQKSDWKSADYVVTDRARKRIELGETR